MGHSVKVVSQHVFLGVLIDQELRQAAQSHSVQPTRDPPGRPISRHPTHALAATVRAELQALRADKLGLDIRLTWNAVPPSFLRILHIPLNLDHLRSKKHLRAPTPESDDEVEQATEDEPGPEPEPIKKKVIRHHKPVTPSSEELEEPKDEFL
ncbi:hypothetical protein FRC11_005169 [Ceratobasidium sp. 423]|nr:hypothetical protein FRC11_005169 [Ceratobasidium sp. 423]